MAKLYKSGLTVYQLAEVFGIARQTVGIILRRHGVATRRSIPCADWPELAALRRDGWSLARLAAKWCASDSAVRNALKKQATQATARP
jgi:lambda repressor-like predicted transcriptional regulator